MSIRSDVMVLTVFELFKVSIEIAIKKKRLSIDVLAQKKVSKVPPRDTSEWHTGDCPNGKATFSVAEARYPVDTVRNVSTDVVGHRAQRSGPARSQVSRVTQLFLPCRCGADIRGGAHE